MFLRDQRQLMQCVDLEDVLEPYDPETRAVAEKVVRPIVEYVLKDDESGLALILDGIDESIFFTRRGGFVLLFNLLRELRIPILLTARSEFWNLRLEDLRTAFFSHRMESNPPTWRWKLVELLEWEDEQIAALIARFRDTVKGVRRRARLEEILALVRSGRYRDYYGDIPRRPLFLRFILETVAESGPRPQGRSTLFLDWARLKIRRDLAHPVRKGGAGRLPITNQQESYEATMDLAMLAMEEAAWLMVQTKDGEIELLSSCSVDDLVRRMPRLGGMVEPTGLVLQSLLRPVRLPGEPGPRLGFGHRTYQEFFLALHLLHHPADLATLRLPPSVAE